MNDTFEETSSLTDTDRWQKSTGEIYSLGSLTTAIAWNLPSCSSWNTKSASANGETGNRTIVLTLTAKTLPDEVNSFMYIDRYYFDDTHALGHVHRDVPNQRIIDLAITVTRT